MQFKYIKHSMEPGSEVSCYCNQASGDYRLIHVQYVHCTCTCIVYLIVYVIVNDTREYYL